jgi:hypothetical protein
MHNSTNQTTLIPTFNASINADAQLNANNALWKLMLALVCPMLVISTAACFVLYKCFCQSIQILPHEIENNAFNHIPVITVVGEQHHFTENTENG